MSPKALRLSGVILIVAAFVLAVLNLKRVANAGTFWVSTPLLVIGLAFLAMSRRRR